MARQRQVEEAGVGVAGSRLAQKAYRDAYLSVKLSQVGGIWDVTVTFFLSVEVSQVGGM